MTFGWEERKCAYCGKPFIPAPYHRYAMYDGRIIFCCYTHKLYFERQRDEQKRAEREKAGKRAKNK